MVASQLVEDSSLIAIESMDNVDAVALLEKKLGIREGSDTDGRQSNIGEPAAVLEYMPLALVQAAAYISQRAPRFSVSQYPDKFGKSDREKTSLLDNEAEQLRRDREAKSDGRGNDFEEDLLVLRNYAFIPVSEIQSAFKMHTLVQLAMKTWLKAKGDIERWR